MKIYVPVGTYTTYPLLLLPVHFQIPTIYLLPVYFLHIHFLLHKWKELLLLLFPVYLHSIIGNIRVFISKSALSTALIETARCSAVALISAPTATPVVCAEVTVVENVLWIFFVENYDFLRFEKTMLLISVPNFLSSQKIHFLYIWYLKVKKIYLATKLSFCDLCKVLRYEKKYSQSKFSRYFYAKSNILYGNRNKFYLCKILNRYLFNEIWRYVDRYIIISI